MSDISLQTSSCGLRALQVVCTVKLDDGVVPCDVQFDPLSKQYLLLMCRNGSISMYGLGEDQQTLMQVKQLLQQQTMAGWAAFPGIWSCNVAANDLPTVHKHR